MRSRKSKREPTAAGARETALRALSRREHSAAELQYKLAQRGHDGTTVAQVIGGLSAAGWQSDVRYTEMLVRNRAEQGYGPLRIEHELGAAGIAEALIREALAAAALDWNALCAQLHARKFRSAPAAADWQKQYRYLASHGYSAEQIRRVLKRAPGEETD